MPFFILSVCDAAYECRGGHYQMLVSALNNTQAREIANSHCSKEGGIWTDPSITTCNEVEDTSLRGYPAVVMQVTLDRR